MPVATAFSAFANLSILRSVRLGAAR